MEKEITYDDVLMFIVKNKDNEEMMADLNRTTFPFTAKYKRKYASWSKQGADDWDNFLFEELRQKLSEKLISTFDCDAKTARTIAKKRINKDEYEFYKQAHTFDGIPRMNQQYVLWDFYDDCEGRISDIERMLSWDDERILDGMAWLSRRLDWFDLECFRAMTTSENREDILLHLAK